MTQLYKIESIVMVVALLVSSIALIEKRERSRLSLFVLLCFLTILDLNRTFDLIVLSTPHQLILSNISMLVEMLFYFLIFYNVLQTQSKKQAILLFVGTYTTFAIINALYIQPLHIGYSNYSFVLGSILVLSTILFYFREQLQGDGYRTIFKNFWFWYAAALFFFLATEVPIMSILNHLLQTQNVQAAIPILKLKIIVSSFYYLSFSIAYLLCRNKT